MGIFLVQSRTILTSNFGVVACGTRRPRRSTRLLLTLTLSGWGSCIQSSSLGLLTIGEPLHNDRGLVILPHTTHCHRDQGTGRPKGDEWTTTSDASNTDEYVEFTWVKNVPDDLVEWYKWQINQASDAKHIA